MLILTREEIRRAVTMDAAMDAVAGAFAQLCSGAAEVPLRTPVAIPSEEGVALFMPAYLRSSGGLGIKALTLLPHNPNNRDLPAISAVVLLLDAQRGGPLALLDAGYLTALRT